MAKKRTPGKHPAEVIEWEHYGSKQWTAAPGTSLVHLPSSVVEKGARGRSVGLTAGGRVVEVDSPLAAGWL
eukprot:gene8240-3159_t